MLERVMVVPPDMETLMVRVMVVPPVTDTDLAAMEATERVAWATALELEVPKAVLPSLREPLCVATNRLLALASVIPTAQLRAIAASTMRNSVVR